MNFPNLKFIETSLQKAHQPVKLVAVTKSFDLFTTEALIEAGVKAIAENRLEAAEAKFPHLPLVEKHFIGRIQSKKIKKIIELFDVIESVSSTAHLLKMDQLTGELNKILEVFLQFNISGEAQKAGFLPEQVEEIKKILPQLHFIKVTGVMGMAQEGVSDFVLPQQFKKLREIRDQLQKYYPQIKELSMGMSADYQIALEEGATVVRIGRALSQIN